MCAECTKPRPVYSAKALSKTEIQTIEFVRENLRFVCGSDLCISKSQSITTNQRLVCTSLIERNYYSLKCDKPIVCHLCASPLDEPGVQQFLNLKTQYRTVLPACTNGDCPTKKDKGWVVSRPNPKGVKAKSKNRRQSRKDKILPKRKAAALKIDLSKWKPHKLEDNFERWLTDSKLAWSQITYQNNVRRQMKKQRQSE